MDLHASDRPRSLRERAWGSVARSRMGWSEQIRRNYSEEYRKSHAAAEIPAGAYGEPEDLAVLAVFLASPLAHYISDAVIPVDGGLRGYAY